VTTSLALCPYFYGLNCDHITRPDLLKSAAEIALSNPHFQILRIVATQCENGGLEMATAMKENPDSGIIYWDLSQNHIADIAPLLSGLGMYRSPIRSIKLTDCNLDGFEIITLLSSLIDNHSLHNLEQLCLIGNKMTTSHCIHLASF
jgi:hypothetical protein